MPLNPQFAAELVGTLNLLHQRPFNEFTKAITHSGLAAALVQFYAEHDLQINDAMHMVDVIEGPVAGRAAARFILVTNKLESFDLMVLLTEQLNYVSKTEDGVMVIQPEFPDPLEPFVYTEPVDNADPIVGTPDV